MTLIIAVLCLIFVCASNNPAQQISNSPITGGYNVASVTDHEVVAAAKYAVKAQAKKTGSKIKLISVKCAEQQVVAGMNYRLDLNVEITKWRKKESQTVEIIVYKNLKQKYSLTSWTSGDCSAR